MTDACGRRGDRGRQPHHAAELVRQELRRGGRRHEHRDDEDGPHRLEAEHARGGHRRHEAVVHRRGADAHAGRERRIEARDPKLLPEEGDHRPHRQQQRRQFDERLGHLDAHHRAGVEGHELDEPVEHAAGIEIDLPGREGDHHDAEGEEGREHHAHRGVFGHLPPPGEARRERRREHPHARRTEQHRHRVARAGDEERQGQSRQDGVADRVAQERQTPEHEEAPRHGAAHAADHRGRKRPPVIGGVDHRRARRPRRLARERGLRSQGRRADDDGGRQQGQQPPRDATGLRRGFVPRADGMRRGGHHGHRDQRGGQASGRREPRLELGDDARGEHVLDLIGVAVDVIRGDVGLLDEEELPQPVGPDDAGRLAAPLEREHVAARGVRDQPGSPRPTQRAAGGVATERLGPPCGGEVALTFQRLVHVTQHVMERDATPQRDSPHQVGHEPASGRGQQRHREQHGGHEDDHRARGPSASQRPRRRGERVAEHRAGKAAQAADGAGQHEQRREAVGPEACGDAGNDQERDHEHGSHRGQAGHRADAHERHEQEVEQEGGPPQSCREGPVEAQELELLVEQQRKPHHGRRRHGDQLRVAAHHARGLAEDEAIESRAVTARRVLHEAAQDDAHAEEAPDGDGDRRVLLHAGEGTHRGDEQGGEDAADQGAGHQRPEMAIAHQQVRAADARQGGVRDRVAHEAPPAERRERPHHGRGDTQQRRAGEHGARVRVLQEDESKRLGHATLASRRHGTPARRTASTASSRMVRRPP